MKHFPILFGLLFSVPAFAAPIYVTPNSVKDNVVAAGPGEFTVCKYERDYTQGTTIGPVDYILEWVCDTYLGKGASDPVVITVEPGYPVRVSGARWAWEYNSAGDLVPMAVFDGEF